MCGVHPRLINSDSDVEPIGDFNMYQEVCPKAGMESHRRQIKGIEIILPIQNRWSMMSGFFAQVEANARLEWQKQSWTREQISAQMESIPVIHNYALWNCHEWWVSEYWSTAPGEIEG